MDARIVKAASITLSHGMRTADAVQHIIRECMNQAMSNAAMIDRSNPEAVHQTRVGLRRTRSALTLFKKHLDKDGRKRQSLELRISGNVLGPSRDWDVFIADSLPKIIKHVHIDPEQLERIRHKASDKREKTYDERSTQEVLFTDDAITIALRGHDLDDAIDDVAPDLLDRQSRRVKRKMRHIGTPEDRHALRKAMKTLRYSVEFFASLYSHKSVKAYLDRCKAAQDVLGEMNDASTMIRLYGELVEPMTNDLMQWMEQQQTKADSHLAGTITDFKSAKPFWD